MRVIRLASFGVLLVVALQGCGSEPVPAANSGGTSANAGGPSNGGSGGASGGDAGGSGEAGAASPCSPYAATPAVNELLGSLRSCSTDGDCTTVFAGGRCWSGCFVSVSATRVDEWEAGLTSIAADTCDPSCDILPADPATCPTMDAFCSNGTCSWGCAGERDFEPLDPTEPLGPTEPLDPTEPQCGDDTCAELDVMAPGQDPRIPSGERCCTASGGCGVGQPRLFGAACFDRDQPGAASDGCPDETIVTAFDAGNGFLVVASVAGCCRPDGQCGLTLGSTGETVNLPIGAGCLERSELGAALEAGCQSENLSKELESISCTP